MLRVDSAECQGKRVLGCGCGRSGRCSKRNWLEDDRNHVPVYMTILHKACI